MAGAAAGNTANTRQTDIFAAIERLADLHAKGIITDEELSRKKAELLERL